MSDDAQAKRTKPEPEDGKRPYKYKEELAELQAELVKLQEWIKHEGEYRPHFSAVVSENPIWGFVEASQCWRRLTGAGQAAN